MTRYFTCISQPSILMLLFCLAGWALRLPLLARFPFREDEAIYAYWALHFLHEDPLFLHVWPDKPPIYLWLLAGIFGLTSPETPLQSEAIARWINVAASTLTIPLAAGIARRWWGPRAGVVTAAFLAFNPFAVAFAPTGYTDSTLVLLGMLALAGAVRGRWLWAGIGLGAAIMTKQQGLFYVPLLLALGLATETAASLSGTSPRPHLRWAKKWAKLSIGAALVLVPILYWDSLRWTVAPSPWDLAQRTYSPIGWASIDAWRDRAQAWAGLLWYLAGAWTVWALLLTPGLAAWVAPYVQPWMRSWIQLKARPELARLGRARDGNLAPLLLWGWSIGFLAAHMLTTVQIWDRYLLPLAPVFALVGGGAVSVWHIKSTSRVTRASGVLLVLLAVALLPPGWHAAQGRYPIGGDHGDYDGLHEAVAWLDTHAAPRYILYHQVLGWHYPFYFFHAIRAGQVELRWFPSSPALADNAAKMPFPPKYLVIPAWSPQPDLPLHLRTRGFLLEPRLQSGRFTVMELVRLPHPPCDWCICVHPASQATTRATSLTTSLARQHWALARPHEPGMMSQP